MTVAGMLVTLAGLEAWRLSGVLNWSAAIAPATPATTPLLRGPLADRWPPSRAEPLLRRLEGRSESLLLARSRCSSSDDGSSDLVPASSLLT